MTGYEADLDRLDAGARELKGFAGQATEIASTLGRTLAGMIGEGAYVVSGNQRREVGSFKEAITWLFDQARERPNLKIENTTGKNFMPSSPAVFLMVFSTNS